MGGRLIEEFWPLLDRPKGELGGWLMAQGVPRLICMAPPGPVAVARAAWGARGLFDWDCDGELAFVQPVWAPPLGDRNFIDLAAWSRARPSEVFTRRGAGVWLGEESVWAAEFNRTSLRLHRSPLAWLKDAGRGAVILDTQEARFDLLGLSTIEAENVRHAETVDRLLRTESITYPKIRVPVGA